MAGEVSYQLINDTGSQLNLVETFPTNWSGDTSADYSSSGRTAGFYESHNGSNRIRL